VIKVLALAQLEYQFMGGDLEFLLYSVIFQIPLFIISTETNESKSTDTDTRLWRLSVYSLESSWPFLQQMIANIPFLKDKRPQSLFAAYVNQGMHFVEVMPKSKSIQQCSEWLKQRENKLVRNTKWTETDFMNESLDQDMLLSSCVLLDPLEAWNDRTDLIHGMKISGHDFLSLGPDSFINDAVISCFIEVLNKIKKDPKMIFVSAMDVQLFMNGVEDNKARIRNNLEGMEMILFVSHYDNHYVFIEFRVDSQDETSNVLNVWYADSLGSKNNLIENNLKVCYLLYHCYGKNQSDLERKQPRTYFNDKFNFMKCKDVEEQTDMFNCGIHVLRRMLMYSKLMITEIMESQDKGIIKIHLDKLPPLSCFRIFVVQLILKNSDGVHEDINLLPLFADDESLYTDNNIDSLSLSSNEKITGHFFGEGPNQKRLIMPVTPKTPKMNDGDTTETEDDKSEEKVKIQ
jgi:hypothetical protein